MKRGTNYIEPAELARLVTEAQQAGRMTDELAAAVTMIGRGFLQRYNYGVDHDDAIQDALLNVARHLAKLDPARNCFGYISETVRHAACKLFRDAKRSEDVLRRLAVREQVEADRRGRRGPPPRSARGD